MLGIHSYLLSFPLHGKRDILIHGLFAYGTMCKFELKGIIQITSKTQFVLNVILMEKSLESNLVYS